MLLIVTISCPWASTVNDMIATGVFWASRWSALLGLGAGICVPGWAGTGVVTKRRPVWVAAGSAAWSPQAVSSTPIQHTSRSDMRGIDISALTRGRRISLLQNILKDLPEAGCAIALG